MILGNDFLFVQVPRTSSSSITKVLEGEGGLCPNLHQAMIDPNRPCITNRFVFAFVRNPWDREYSQWTYHSTKEHDFSKRPTFEEWVLWRYSDLELDRKTINPESYDYLRTFSVRPQLGFIMDKDGDLQTNFIGRFESRESDTQFVLRRLSIEVNEFPHAEGSWLKDTTKNYQDFYTPELRDLVAERMMPDIEVFNYVFDQPSCIEVMPSLELLTDYSFLELKSKNGYLHA